MNLRSEAHESEAALLLDQYGISNDDLDRVKSFGETLVQNWESNKVFTKTVVQELLSYCVFTPAQAHIFRSLRAKHIELCKYAIV